MSETQVDRTRDYSPRCSHRCPFCSTEFSTSVDFREHLMLCGNKTDECPNCRKFIRRAVFAYHYENECADLRESSDNTTAISTGFEPSSSAGGQRNSLPLETSAHQESTVNKQRIISDTNRPSGLHPYDDIEHSTITKYLSSDQNCEQTPLNEHEKNCFRSTSRRSSNNDNRHLKTNVQTSDGPSALEILYVSTGINSVPCPHCNDNELFNSEELASHISSYHVPNGLPLYQNSIRQQQIHPKVFCEYCGEQHLLEDLNIHHMDCVKNPYNTSTRATRKLS